MTLRPMDFKSIVAADFTIRALKGFVLHPLSCLVDFSTPHLSA